jgi:hypothetical protein
VSFIPFAPWRNGRESDGTLLEVAAPKDLDAEERDTLNRLRALGARNRQEMLLCQRYYMGEQVIQNLRIAVPPELEFLRTIVGWPALAVDPYVERLAVDGFRLPNASDSDAYLGDLWAANGLDAEFPLAATDALVLGRGYWLVGSPENPGDAPVVTVESPLNMAVEWDLRGITPTAALQGYWKDGHQHATLLMPGKTIHLAADNRQGWEVVDRDEHDFGFVPVVRMPHMPQTTARAGRSAITPSIRSVTDSACRDLLALEVSREFYSVPKVTLLGATESDFQNPDGTTKTQWEALISKYNALEYDADGRVPTIHQLTAYDPSVLIRPLEFRASQMGSLVAAPPQDLGLYTQGNPISAEQTQASEVRRNRRARLMQNTFGPRLVEVMQMVLRFANGGELPAGMEQMATDWRDVDEVPMSLASDAITKQIAAGAIPPRSDVTLKRLGYSAVERRQLQQDWDSAEGDRILSELAARTSGEQVQPDANAG